MATLSVFGSDLGGSRLMPDGWDGHEVLISYSTGADPELSGRLFDDLRERGLQPRIDRRSIPEGAAWLETINGWLETCSAAIVLMTPEALRSPWVRHELSVLVHRREVREDVRLVVVRLGVALDDLDAPELAPLRLGSIQARLDETTATSDEIIENLLELEPPPLHPGRAPFDLLRRHLSSAVGELPLDQALISWATVRAEEERDPASLDEFFWELIGRTSDEVCDVCFTLQSLAEPDDVKKRTIGLSDILYLTQLAFFDLETRQHLTRASDDRLAITTGGDMAAAWMALQSARLIDDRRALADHHIAAIAPLPSTDMGVELAVGAVLVLCASLKWSLPLPEDELYELLEEDARLGVGSAEHEGGEKRQMLEGLIDDIEEALPALLIHGEHVNLLDEEIVEFLLSRFSRTRIVVVPPDAQPERLVNQIGSGSLAGPTIELAEYRRACHREVALLEKHHRRLGRLFPNIVMGRYMSKLKQSESIAS